MAIHSHRGHHLEITGWSGAFLILVAHLLISFRYIEVGLLYQLMSIVGASLLAWDAFFHRAKPAAWLNVVYATIALTAMVRLLISIRP
jgi:hypothetical protein